MKKTSRFDRIQNHYKVMEGRIMIPIILWLLGVPGSVVLVLWFFFFRD